MGEQGMGEDSSLCRSWSVWSRGERVEASNLESLLDGVSPVVELDAPEERVVGIDAREFVVERAEGEVSWSLRIGVEQRRIVVVVVPRSY